MKCIILSSIGFAHAIQCYGPKIPPVMSAGNKLVAPAPAIEESVSLSGLPEVLFLGEVREIKICFLNNLNS